MERIERIKLHLTGEKRREAKTNSRMERMETSAIRCNGNHALPFEAWQVGQRLETKWRTINSEDIVTYTHLTGYDAEDLFGNMEYLRTVGGHSRRLAPGLLTASVADALIVGSGILEGYAIALVEISGLIAKHPVYAGDTISVQLEVTKVKPSTSKHDRGLVTTHQTVINQNHDVVLEYDVTRMLRRSKAA